MTLIDNDFPVGPISDLAQRESWRKEIYRPIYHIHKWWAKRLGSVFRGMILAAALPESKDLMSEFYRRHELNLVIYDPFMGGGTIVGEAIKLGCSAIGRDINPVSYNVVRAALGPINRSRLMEAYEELQRTVASSVESLYKVTSPSGVEVTVLYYFWVKCLPCPKCSEIVELFPTYIFAQNAYPRRKPDARIFCPQCRNIFVGRYDSTWIECPECQHAFNPRNGPARGSKATCCSCEFTFPLAGTAKAAGHPPLHRQYAKLIIDESGQKQYAPIWNSDITALETAARQLKREGTFIPSSPIAYGYNTKQVLNYGYSDWREFFNERQMLALTRLARGIMKLEDGDARAQLAILFSGCLEFNNMFASFKGEGTGAVRHMFAHHVLKPEKMPLEANVWGTPSSSGSFSTLFRTRLLRALEYRERPFEVSTKLDSGVTKTVKRYDTDEPFLGDIRLGNKFGDGHPRSLHLSVGSSHETDIPSESVDLIVTDPPFFDNVHYSELADFFYVWQAPFFGEPQKVGNSVTTRSDAEVQDREVAKFTEKLRAVYIDCARVMKANGRLIFSYHHSRSEGWSAVVEAVMGAGMKFIAAYPVLSEMAVATPKSQAKEPINLDVLFVCKKGANRFNMSVVQKSIQKNINRRARHYALQLVQVLPNVSQNDLKLIYRSQVIACMSMEGANIKQINMLLNNSQEDMKDFIDSIQKGIQYERSDRENSQLL